MENTVVNIYDRPAKTSFYIGLITVFLSGLALYLNITKPLEVSNKGWFMGYAMVSDIINIMLAYIVIILFLYIAIFLVIRLGFYGRKSRFPIFSNISIAMGGIIILFEIISIILITVQIFAIY